MSELIDRPVVVAPEPPAGAPGRWRPQNPRMAAAVTVLGVLLLYGMLTTEGFASLDNGRAIIASMVITGFAAIGATVIMISGNLFSMSLSVTAAGTGMIFLAALDRGIVVALVIAIVVAALVQAVQGFVVGAWEANPIIVTIGAGSLQIAVATMLTSGSSVQAPAGGTAEDFLADTLVGIPVGGYLLAVVAVVIHVLMTRTPWGQVLFLTGQSRRAAHAAALPVAATIVIAFAIAGVCVAFAGLLQAAALGTASISDQSNLTFDAVAAAVVGGTAIAGGRGSIARTMVGVLVIATVSDLLLLRGYSAGTQLLTSGLLVLTFVLATGRAEEAR